ncbi:MAG: ABC transporter ATP-binding protein [Chitinophagales bacterium]|nr:ABC transporter ATP-binding protein [Chitinophagales bacterium]
MSGSLRILSYIRKYPTLVLLNIFFNILYIVFSLFSLVLIVPFLDILFSQTELRLPPKPVFVDLLHLGAYGKEVLDYYFINAVLSEGKPVVLLYICIVIIIVFFLKNIFNYLSLWVMAPVRYGVVKDIRKQLYDKILVLPLSFFSKERKGDLITRMSTDVQEVEKSIMSTLEVAFREPMTIIFHLCVMLYISPSLTLFVLFMILVMALVVGNIGKNLKRVSKKGQEKLGQLMSLIEETLTGIKIVKAFNAENYQRQRFRNENGNYFLLMTKMLRRRSLASPLSEFLSIIIVAMILWYGGQLVLGGEIEAKGFILFILVFATLIPPAKNFSSAFYNIQQGLASSERIDGILNADNEIHEQPNAQPISEFKETIEYKNVHFAYYNYDNIPVLKDINVTIRKGKMLALVGQSGSGKSTFVDLLPRFYDVLKGKILIDGRDIREFRLKDLRGLMGIVSQEAILFNDTVHNNIAFGMENVTREDVIRAAKVANADEFISRMESGYDTYIGDRGNKLSGGEKQRLTIARAVLNDPPILILDEATSSLDTKSEKLVQEAIYKLMENRTTIVIAHRLSTIQFADEILVMQYGEIIERGNHIGLMAKNGTYKKLVELQAF